MLHRINSPAAPAAVASQQISPVDIDSTVNGDVIVTARSVREESTAAWTLYLWRLRPDGSIDTTFGLGGDGMIALEFPAGINDNLIHTSVAPDSSVAVL